MKKLYFFVLSSLAGLTLNAQILSQSNNAPVLGEMFRTTDCSTTGVTPGASGTGVTWDMSAVSIGTAITVNTVVTVASTGSAASYPSASVAVQNSVTSDNLFYSSSATDLKFWGGSIKVSTVSATMNYSTPAILANYNMVFNTANTNTVAGTLFALSQSGSFTGTCSIILDGTGTLALPTRTFTNVMRKKVTQDLSFTVGFVSGTILQETYEYFEPSLAKSPLFTILSSTFTTGFGNSSTSLAMINTDYQYVGINESSKEVAELNVFPNPAKDNFNLTFVNDNASDVNVEITNSIGQLVKKETLPSSKGMVNHLLNVAELKAGIYFVKIDVGSKSSVRKLTVQ